MAPPSMREEYAELMKGNGEGHFLYTPQRYSDLHPGSVGYFDGYGRWVQITDISEEGRPEKDGFTGIKRPLTMDRPTESMWKTVSSGSEAESSFGLDAGLSGALSAAPVDVSANAKNKVGSTGKAALITTEVVKNERFAGAPGPSIAGWVKDNAKALVKSDYGDDIKDYGLWAIHTTWSTPECAITMESGHSRDTSAGAEVGATGIAKVGASGSSLKKLESKGWKTYEATEGDQGLVVSFGGAGFKLHRIQAFRSMPLKQTEKQAATANGYYKPTYDENGNQNGVALYRDVYDDAGNRIGEEKVDVEAERKAAEQKRKEEEEKEKEEGEGDSGPLEEEIFIESEPIGLSEKDLEAQRSAELQEKRELFWQQAARIKAIPDEATRNAQLTKLLNENPGVMDTTVTYTEV